PAVLVVDVVPCVLSGLRQQPPSRLFPYTTLFRSMNNFGMKFAGLWLDLHNSDENEHNVETEYEHKFSSKGQPIYKLTATMPKKEDRKSTRLNSSHVSISYAVFCLKNKNDSLSSNV